MDNINQEKDIKSKTSQRILLLVILLLPSLAYLFLSTGEEHFITLPYYGPREPVEILKNGEMVTDTVYHRIPDFSLIRHDGRPFTRDHLKGKIFVADYFFATCQSICPKMTSNMLRIQQRFKDTPGLLFISHTVDPEHDSSEVLLQYAQMVHADTSNWFFLTGEKKALYDLARNGYLITAVEGNGGPEDFIHSEKLVLVDKEGCIRGFYDGTTVSSCDSLVDDIRVLMADYARRTQAQKEKIEQRK
ncbi:MAG: SCO family protein [Bacteroidia bacterium]|nr:SCO family protein [Bacteroidia bacterium]